MEIIRKLQAKAFVNIILIHILLWGGFFLISYLFISNYDIEFDLTYYILVWLIYLSVFYLNYLFLMPRLFFKKRFLIYISFSIIMLVGTYFIRSPLEHSHFNKIMQSEIGERRRGLNMHDEDFTPPPFEKFEKPLNRPRGPKQFPLFHSSFYSIVLVFLTSILVRFIQKWQDDEKLNAAIEKERIATELSFLKQQVNPHFLFNALNSIYSMTITTSKAASDGILKLSSILRYMLYETEHRQVALYDEAAILSDYIALQELRLADNIHVNYHLQGNLSNYKIAPLLLLPLIENAFKHGIDNMKDSYIDILLSMEGNKLELLVRNPILQKEKEQKSDSGIGIKNIKRRLDLLYPENYFFDIEQKEDIFSVLLQLHLKE